MPNCDNHDWNKKLLRVVDKKVNPCYSQDKLYPIQNLDVLDTLLVLEEYTASSFLFCKAPASKEFYAHFCFNL